MQKGGAYYGAKDIFITVRVDYYTYHAVEELMKLLGTKNRSKVIRASVWFLVLLTNPNTTLRKLFKDSSLEKLCKGEDIAFVDAVESFEKILKEIFETSVKKR